RTFRTESRDVTRERSLETVMDASSQRLEQWLASEDPSPLEKTMRQEQLFRLAEGLAALPPDQQLAVTLKHLHDWPVEDISRRMGRSEASIAGLLRRGLMRLRELLSESS